MPSNTDDTEIIEKMLEKYGLFKFRNSDNNLVTRCKFCFVLFYHCTCTYRPFNSLGKLKILISKNLLDENDSKCRSCDKVIDEFGNKTCIDIMCRGKEEKCKNRLDPAFLKQIEEYLEKNKVQLAKSC